MDINDGKVGIGALERLSFEHLLSELDHIAKVFNSKVDQ